MAWYDALTGLLKSAVQGPIGQNIVGGALGAATQGDPYTIERYWGGIERQRQHKQLEALAHNLGVIQPGQALPPGIETPQDLGMLTPQRKYTKGGYWEERIGQPPVFVPGGPAEQPKMHGTQEELGEMEAVFYAQHGAMPTTPADYESVRDIARTNLAQKKLADYQARRPPEKPKDVFPYVWDASRGAWIPKPGLTGSPEAVPVPNLPPKQTTAAGKTVGEIGNFVNKKGELAPPEMLGSEAAKAGYQKVPQQVVDKIGAGQQSLVMLRNIAQTVADANAKGKLLKGKGIGGVWNKGELKWDSFSGDPDLAMMQAQSSQMVSLMRMLGEKGPRAMAAFAGAMNILETGRAPYETIQKFLRNVETEIRAGAPRQAPNAYDPIGEVIPEESPEIDKLIQRHISP